MRSISTYISKSAIFSFGLICILLFFQGSAIAECVKNESTGDKRCYFYYQICKDYSDEWEIENRKDYCDNWSEEDRDRCVQNCKDSRVGTMRYDFDFYDSDLDHNQDKPGKGENTVRDFLATKSYLANKGLLDDKPEYIGKECRLSDFTDGDIANKTNVQAAIKYLKSNYSNEGKSAIYSDVTTVSTDMYGDEYDVDQYVMHNRATWAADMMCSTSGEWRTHVATYSCTGVYTKVEHDEKNDFDRLYKVKYLSSGEVIKEHEVRGVLKTINGHCYDVVEFFLNKNIENKLKSKSGSEVKPYNLNRLENETLEDRFYVRRVRKGAVSKNLVQVEDSENPDFVFAPVASSGLFENNYDGVGDSSESKVYINKTLIIDKPIELDGLVRFGIDVPENYNFILKGEDEVDSKPKYGFSIKEGKSKDKFVYDFEPLYEVCTNEWSNSTGDLEEVCRIQPEQAFYTELNDKGYLVDHKTSSAIFFTSQYVYEIGTLKLENLYFKGFPGNLVGGLGNVEFDGCYLNDCGSSDTPAIILDSYEKVENSEFVVSDGVEQIGLKVSAGGKLFPQKYSIYSNNFIVSDNQYPIKIEGNTIKTIFDNEVEGKDFPYEIERERLFSYYQTEAHDSGMQGYEKTVFLKEGTSHVDVDFVEFYRDGKVVYRACDGNSKPFEWRGMDEGLFPFYLPGFDFECDGYIGIREGDCSIVGKESGCEEEGKDGKLRIEITYDGREKDLDFLYNEGEYCRKKDMNPCFDSDGSMCTSDHPDAYKCHPMKIVDPSPVTAVFHRVGGELFSILDVVDFSIQEVDDSAFDAAAKKEFAAEDQQYEDFYTGLLKELEELGLKAMVEKHCMDYVIGQKQEIADIKGYEYKESKKTLDLKNCIMGSGCSATMFNDVSDYCKDSLDSMTPWNKKQVYDTMDGGPIPNGTWRGSYKSWREKCTEVHCKDIYDPFCNGNMDVNYDTKVCALSNACVDWELHQKEFSQSAICVKEEDGKCVKSNYPTKIMPISLIEGELKDVEEACRSIEKTHLFDYVEEAYTKYKEAIGDTGGGEEIVEPEECVKGEFFNQLTGECEKDPNMKACENNFACLGDEICVEGFCEKLECEEGQLIKSHECIDPFNVEGCEFDGDCDDDEICTDDNCVELECEENQYIEDHKCIDEDIELLECEQDYECDVGFGCEFGHCVRVCESNEDCGEADNLICGEDGKCKVLACGEGQIPSDHECVDAKGNIVVKADAGPSSGCSLASSGKQSFSSFVLLFLSLIFVGVRRQKALK